MSIRRADNPPKQILVFLVDYVTQLIAVLKFRPNDGCLNVLRAFSFQVASI